MRFVVQIEADHRGVGLVSVGQGHPVGHPGILGVGAVVPQAVVGCSRAGATAVVVEDHPHTLLSGVGDDRIHHLHTRKTLQVSIFGEVNSIGCGGGMQQLTGVRQPDGVEPQSGHLVDHLLVTACPQAVRGSGGGLHAEPVDSGDLDRLALRVDDLITRGAQEARRHPTGTRLGGGGVGDTQPGCHGCGRGCATGVVEEVDRAVLVEGATETAGRTAHAGGVVRGLTEGARVVAFH